MPLTAFPKKNLNIPPGTPCKKFTIEISAPSLPQALLVHVSGGIFLWQSETKAAPTQRHNRPVTANPISRSNVHLLTALNRSFGWLVSKKVTDYQTEMSEAICWLIVQSQITGGAGRWQPGKDSHFILGSHTPQFSSEVFYPLQGAFMLLSENLSPWTPHRLMLQASLQRDLLRDPPSGILFQKLECFEALSLRYYSSVLKNISSRIETQT